MRKLRSMLTRTCTGLTWVALRWQVRAGAAGAGGTIKKTEWKLQSVQIAARVCECALASNSLQRRRLWVVRSRAAGEMTPGGSATTPHLQPQHPALSLTSPFSTSSPPSIRPLHRTPMQPSTRGPGLLNCCAPTCGIFLQCCFAPHRRRSLRARHAVRHPCHQPLTFYLPF